MSSDASRSAAPPDPSLRERSIRSFVLRQGRVTPAQRRAFTEHWPRFGVDYSGSERDLDALFGRTAEHVFEIGFGNGEQLAFAAGNERGRDFIGVEVHGPGVGRLLNDLAAGALANVRVYQHDAVEVLKHEIRDGSLQEVRIYFPDPWHKKRHHKRRLLQPEFAQLLCAKLAHGGLLHLATDWADYARHMWEVLDAEPMLENIAGPGAAVPRPDWRRQTHFETRGQNLGHGVWDLLYRRR
jgi:tRNA (guanine-N7-)-methyltransferase